MTRLRSNPCTMLRASIRTGRTCTSLAGRRVESSLAGSRSSVDTSKSPRESTTQDSATSQANSRTAPFSDQKPPLEDKPVNSSSTSDASASEMTSDLDTRPMVGFEVLKGRMQEWSGAVRQRVDVYSERATTTFFQLARHLNRATGYDAIDLLKRQVVEQGASPLYLLC